MKSFFPAFILTLTIAIGGSFPEAEKAGADYGATALEDSDPAITIDDLKRYVTKLASEEFEGRGTGDQGEQMATAYFATFLEGLGLQPEGDDDTFFQSFEFRAGMELKGENSLTITQPCQAGQEYKPGEDYLPITFSSSGEVDAEAVFCGFGIEHGDYNSFAGLNVKGKWIVVLRGHPADTPELKRFGPLLNKANFAKKLGAAGILFIKADNPAVGPELVPLSVSVGGKEILPAATIKDTLAATLFDEDLATLFESYSKKEEIAGFDLPFQIQTKTNLIVKNNSGRNVLGRLVVGDEPSKQTIVLGGHIDHLGFGNRGGSRAKGEDLKKLHPGADDNASGIAVIMELAQLFTDQKKAGTLQLDRDIIFAGWSGEEIGLWGSRHYIKEAREETDKKVHPGISAYINLDMVGRASKEGLTISGTASAKQFKEIIDSISANPDLKINPLSSPYVPSDSTPFYQAGVPILALRTQLHDDYHTPQDTTDKIDFSGMQRITNYTKALIEELANRAEAPEYVQVPRQRASGVKIGIRLEPADGKSILVKEVGKDSPAQKAGILAGDFITELNGNAITTPESLVKEVRTLTPKAEYDIVIKRGEETLKLKIKPTR